MQKYYNKITNLSNLSRNKTIMRHDKLSEDEPAELLITQQKNNDTIPWGRLE